MYPQGTKRARNGGSTWTKSKFARAPASGRQSFAGASSWATGRASTGSFAPTARVSALTPETKYFDVSIDAVVSGTDGNWAGKEVPCLNYINSSGTAEPYTDSCLIPTAIGSGYGQINGNRYKLKKIRVRGHVTTGAYGGRTSATDGQMSLLCLIMDTQPNGAQAQSEEIFQDMGNNPENIYSFKRTAASSGRFRILKDAFLNCKPTTAFNDTATTGAEGFELVPFSFTYAPRIPLQINVKSGNSTPTVAGAESVNIFLVMYSVLNGVLNGGVIRGCSRVYYCD